MSLTRFLRSFSALKSNRSQDPVVVSNIKLSNCKDLNEVFEVIKENSFKNINFFFALRIIARLIQSSRQEVKFIYGQEYDQLIDEVNKRFDNIKSLEFTDFSYFIKITQEYGRKNLTISQQEYEEKMNKMFFDNSFTLKQMLNILHYGQTSGINTDKIFSKTIQEFLAQKNFWFEMSEFKHLSRSLKLQRVGINRNILDDINEKFTQFVDKHSLDLNAILFISKNLTSCYEYSSLKYNTDHIFSKVYEKIDHLSENDYQLIFKIDREFPGTINKLFMKKLTDRIEHGILKNSSRITNSFLIDIIPLLEPNPENAKLVDIIINYLLEKVNSRELKLSQISMLCLNTIRNPREEINYVFNHKLLSTVAAQGYLDILLYKSRYTDDSYFTEFRVAESRIENYLNRRSIRSLLNHYYSLLPFNNRDILLFNKKMYSKLDEFISTSTMNARAIVGQSGEVEKFLFNGKSLLENHKKSIAAVMQTDFSYSSFMFLMLMDVSIEELSNYLNKYESLMDKNILGTALVENSYFISDSTYEFLLKRLDFPEINLAYLIQGFRKAKQHETYQKISKHDFELYRKTDVWKTYEAECKEILDFHYKHTRN